MLNLFCIKQCWYAVASYAIITTSETVICDERVSRMRAQLEVSLIHRQIKNVFRVNRRKYQGCMQ